MARINIDAKFFADGRIKLLCLKLKESLFTTRGRLMELWFHCYQQRSPIIEDDLIKALCEHEKMPELLLLTNLAERIDESHLRIKGIEKRIGYLLKASELGKKGAEKRWGSDGVPHANPMGYPIGSECPLSSSSSSSSSSLAVINNNLPTVSRIRVPDLNVNEFIACYCEVFKQRYGTNPIIDGKTQGIAKRVLKTLGIEKAKKFIAAYLSLGMDPWISSNKHNLAIFEKNINAIAVFAETGKYMTLQEAQNRERNLLAKKPAPVNNF